MDLGFLRKGLDLCNRNKKWVFLLALFGVSSYGGYHVYHLPSVTRKRRRLLKLLTALFSVIELVSDSSETIGVLSKDLNEFIKSDSDEIPNSLRQLSKIARGDEFSDLLSRIFKAIMIGTLKGYRSEITNDGGSGENQLMDRILSNGGTRFCSVVAGSFARNLVLGFYSNGELVESSNGDRIERAVSGMDVPCVPSWVSVICSKKCEEMMVSCIQVFVSTAVTIYFDKTLDINTYDEVFSALTNPTHESKVKDLLVSVCNSSVKTFIKTSYHVLTSRRMSSGSDSSPSHSLVDHRECANGKKKAIEVVDRQVSRSNQDGGRGSMVLSTLSVPRNRKFVLDVTGRVTCETFRSVVGFLKWKLSDGLRRSCDSVHDCVVDRGLQVVRYCGLKSYALLTICLALLLHIIFGTKALLLA